MDGGDAVTRGFGIVGTGVIAAWHADALAQQHQPPVVIRSPPGVLDLREQDTPAEVRVDLGRELAVDEPQLDAGVAPPAAERDGGGQGRTREGQRAKGDAHRRTRETADPMETAGTCAPW